MTAFNFSTQDSGLLNPLKRDEAKEAIVQPAIRNGVKFEAGLVDTILDELARNEKAGDLIAPPQLQLVCSALYDSLNGAKEITRERYDSFGRTTGILSSYLKNVIKSLPDDEREVAPKLLEALIDSNKQRVRRTRAELTKDSGLRGVQPDIVDKTLRRLERRRLLRIQEEDSPGTITYELAHDYLVEDISVSEQVLARKRVQELLDRRLLEFKQHKILLGAEELAIINPYRQELAASSEAEKLIAASARKLKLRRRFVISFAGFVAVLALTTIILMIFALRAQQTIRDADESMRRLFENNGIIPTGYNPRALAFDGKHIWVANVASAKLQGINPHTGKIENIIVLDHVPGFLYFDGKRLWVTNTFDHTFQEIDTETGRPRRKIKLSDSPIAMTSDGQRIWTLYFWSTETGGGAVQAVNPETGDTGPLIKVEKSSEAIAFDGTRVWVASKNRDTLQSIDPAYGKTSDPLDAGMQPDILVYVKQRLWLVSRDFAIFKVLNPETREIITPDPLEGDSLTGGTPLLDLISDGSRLWISATDNSVRSIDPETYTVSESIRVGASPLALAFDGMRLWVANRSDMTVQALEPAAAFIGAPVQLRILPQQQGDVGVRAMAANGNFLYVAQNNVLQPLDLSRPDYMATHPLIYDFCPSALMLVDNSLWFVNQCEGSVQAIDLVSRRISDPIMVGQQPGYMIFDGKRVWLSNVASNSVQAIDVSSHVASAPIPVGQAPMTLAFDGKRVWVLTNQSLQSIDPARGQVTSTLNYFGRSGASLGVYATPLDMVFAAGKLWIVSNDTEMRALDPDTQRVTAEVRVGAGAKFLTFDGTRLWVANREKNTLRAVDPNSLSLGVPIGIGAKPTNMIFDGERLWISYQDSGVVQPVAVR